MNTIVSLTGFIGSGKNAVADYLVDRYGFQKGSFAASVKDCLSVIFSWDREALEGSTKESRIWREKVDVWWAERLNIPHLSPRWMLQHFGTEVCRNTLHNDIWVASLEKKIKDMPRVVLTDSRFPNEMHVLRKMNAITCWVQRGELPEFYDCAFVQNTTPGLQHAMLIEHGETMEQKYPHVHYSEWAWIGQPMDVIIENNGSLEELHEEVTASLEKVLNA